MAEKVPGEPEPSGTENFVTKTLEDGGKPYTAISVTFLLACLYVLITVASTNHRELLVGDTPKLPILDVSISLEGFFIGAPILILVLHSFLLLQSYMLVKRLQDGQVNELRGGASFFLSPALPVVHKTPSSLEILVARLVWVALWIPNILLPLAVFCVAQGVFLPYHSFWITLGHQIVVVIDLVIAWCFLAVLFPLRDNRVRWGRASRVMGGVVTVIVLFYAFVLAVVPGTWFEIWTGKHRLAGLVRRNLVLNQNTGGAGLAGASLAGRDLRGADFEGAVLVKADLRGADLTEAILEDANLRGANLGPLNVKTPTLTQVRSAQKIKDIEEEIRKGTFKPTRLNGANLKNARFEGASLILASLAQADLRKAHLQGVEMTGVHLRLALLQSANLAGADLSFASMEGADLTEVQAHGTTFDHASMSGASLDQAKAPAASFVSANLEGARLTEAVLKAANFYGAVLTGSDFRRAFLQGASSLQLDATDLRGAHLGGICNTSVFGLTDYRSVDLAFLSAEDWGNLKREVEEKLKGRADEETKAILSRIDEASRRRDATAAQIACLGTLLSSPIAQRNLGFLRLDADRNVIVEGESGNSSWNETAFHKELAQDLLQRACSNYWLALAVASRAVGEHGPGDLDLDHELAKRLLVKLRDPNCRGLQGFSPRLKQQIAWRLRKHARNEEERH